MVCVLTVFQLMATTSGTRPGHVFPGRAACLRFKRAPGGETTAITKQSENHGDGDEPYGITILECLRISSVLDPIFKSIQILGYAASIPGWSILHKLTMVMFI